MSRLRLTKPLPFALPLCAALGLLSIAPQTARAQTFYSTSSSFMAAANVTTISFDGLVTNGSGTYNGGVNYQYHSTSSAGITLTAPNSQTVNFLGSTTSTATDVAGPSQYLIGMENTGNRQYSLNGTDDLLGGKDSLTVTFPSATPTAIGFDLGEQYYPAGYANVTVAFTLADNSSYSESVNLTGTGNAAIDASGSGTKFVYVGFTAPQAIKQVTVYIPASSANPDYPDAVDNFSFGNSTTPEPGAIALLGSGLLVVSATVRRRRRAAVGK